LRLLTFLGVVACTKAKWQMNLITVNQEEIKISGLKIVEEE
jgi:hypothetical protein